MERAREAREQLKEQLWREEWRFGMARESDKQD